MKYRVFTYPVPCDEAVSELNGFLSSHRILRVRGFAAATRYAFESSPRVDALVI